MICMSSFVRVEGGEGSSGARARLLPRCAGPRRRRAARGDAEGLAEQATMPPEEVPVRIRAHRKAQQAQSVRAPPQQPDLVM